MLQAVTNEFIRERLNDQVSEIFKLRDQYCHQIELCALASDTDNYNCFAYCFGISHSDNVQRLAKQFNIIPDSEYAHYLIDQVLEAVMPDSVDDGDYIIYISRGKVTHAGIYARGIITSKWGGHGHLWRHAVWEVPESYGDEVEYYRQLHNRDCETTYLDWVKKRHKVIATYSQQGHCA